MIKNYAVKIYTELKKRNFTHFISVILQYYCNNPGKTTHICIITSLRKCASNVRGLQITNHISCVNVKLCADVMG